MVKCFALLDIDECDLPTKKPCDQVCTNTVGAYTCSCYSGYILDKTNSYSCLGELRLFIYYKYS